MAIDEIGNIKKVQEDVEAMIDFTLKYKITDMDPVEENSYFGYVDIDGNWYIMHLTTTSVRYVKGADGYVNAWADKENLNYDYFYNVF